VTATGQDTDRFVDLPAGPRLCYRVDGLTTDLARTADTNAAGEPR